MRIVLAPAGSRGDFQPMLALAVALRRAGHDVLLITAPNFADEAAAFSIPCEAIGFDVEAYLRENQFEASPLRGAYQLFRIGRREVGRLMDASLPILQRFRPDVIVGAGAQIGAASLAELLKIPYLWVAYTPQAFRSAAHPPFALPLQGMPPLVNRILWSIFIAAIRFVFAGPLNRKRRELGLPEIAHWYRHLFPHERAILAFDGELAPLASDTVLRSVPCGAFHLPDERPLPESVTDFLSAGPKPVYIGFGSMPDARAAETSQLLADAARRAGVRLILSAGWARFSLQEPRDDVLVIGPVSHAQLFQHLAVVVHHGGAGTTSAAVRAGCPQVVVPHAFDQLAWARYVHAAGLGPTPIPRDKLTAERLATALREATTNQAFRVAAASLAARVQARDPFANVVDLQRTCSVLGSVVK